MEYDVMLVKMKNKFKRAEPSLIERTPYNDNPFDALGCETYSLKVEEFSLKLSRSPAHEVYGFPYIYRLSATNAEGMEVINFSNIDNPNYLTQELEPLYEYISAKVHKHDTEVRQKKFKNAKSQRRRLESLLE